MSKSIHVDWANHEETCIVMKFKGRWTIQEYRQSCVRLNELIASRASYPVDVMVDLQRSAPAPAGIVLHGAAVLNALPGNMRTMVFVSKSSFWKTLVTMIDQIHPIKPLDLRFAATPDEAYEVVEC
jgi:hypothetical protein